MARCAATRAQREHLAGHDFLAVQHDEAVHRPHELRLARAPAHELRNRQRLECRIDLRGEHFAEHRALRLDACDYDRTLRRIAPTQLGDRDAVLAREAGDRLLGRACRGTGDLAFAAGALAATRAMEKARRRGVA